MVMITEGVARALSNGTPRKGKPTDRHAANRFYVEVGKTKGTSDFQAVFSEVSNITLKRGLVRSNEFLLWCMRAALEKPMDRRNVSVVLFDQSAKMVIRWNFLNAFPVKWVGPQFTADSTTMAIESIELAHE